MADKKRSKREDAKRELRMLEKEISGGKSLIDYGKVNQVNREGISYHFFQIETIK